MVITDNSTILDLVVEGDSSKVSLSKAEFVSFRGYLIVYPLVVVAQPGSNASIRFESKNLQFS
jgi:hypothetical protein